MERLLLRRTLCKKFSSVLVGAVACITPPNSHLQPCHKQRLCICILMEVQDLLAQLETSSSRQIL